MTDERKVIERLERIEAKENLRLLYGRIQMALVAGLAVAVIGIFMIILPKVNGLYLEGKEVMSQAQELLDETELILEDLDLSQLEKLNVEGLNQAIESINQTVEKLEKFFALFKR